MHTVFNAGVLLMDLKKLRERGNLLLEGLKFLADYDSIRNRRCGQPGKKGRKRGGENSRTANQTQRDGGTGDARIGEASSRNDGVARRTTEGVRNDGEPKVGIPKAKSQRSRAATKNARVD